jgi:hypothetical protein
MPVAPSTIDKLFRLTAEDPGQSFEINCWCFARAMRMTGVLLLNGVAPSDIGWVVICSPPAWLFEDGQQPVMTAPAAKRFSIQTLLGGRSEVVFENYLFRAIPTSVGADVVILSRNGEALMQPGSSQTLHYRFADPDGTSWWDNHIAPTVVCANENQSRIVIDPEIADAPVTPREWRLRQDSRNCTCLLDIHSSGRATIDRSNSSPQTLNELSAANRRLNGDECDESDLIAFLTDGEILGGAFSNPYVTSGLADTREPSIVKVFESFGQWLAPLAAFKRWRVEMAARLAIDEFRDRRNTATIAES